MPRRNSPLASGAETNLIGSRKMILQVYLLYSIPPVQLNMSREKHFIYASSRSVVSGKDAICCVTR